MGVFTSVGEMKKAIENKIGFPAFLGAVPEFAFRTFRLGGKHVGALVP